MLLRQLARAQSVLHRPRDPETRRRCTRSGWRTTSRACPTGPRRTFGRRWSRSRGTGGRPRMPAPGARRSGCPARGDPNAGPTAAARPLRRLRSRLAVMSRPLQPGGGCWRRRHPVHDPAALRDAARAEAPRGAPGAGGRGRLRAVRVPPGRRPASHPADTRSEESVPTGAAHGRGPLRLPSRFSWRRERSGKVCRETRPALTCARRGGCREIFALRSRSGGLTRIWTFCPSRRTTRRRGSIIRSTPDWGICFYLFLFRIE